MEKTARLNSKTKSRIISLFPNGAESKERFSVLSQSSGSTASYQLRRMLESGFIKEDKIKLKDDLDTELRYIKLEPEGYELIVKELLEHMPWVKYLPPYLNKVTVAYKRTIHLVRKIESDDIMSLVLPIRIASADEYRNSFPDIESLELSEKHIRRIIFEAKKEWFTAYIKAARNGAEYMLYCPIQEWDIRKICSKAMVDYDYVCAVLYDRDKKREKNITGVYLTTRQTADIMKLSEKDKQSISYNHNGILIFGSTPYPVYHIAHKTALLSDKSVKLLKKHITLLCLEMGMNNPSSRLSGFMVYYNTHDIIRQLKKEYIRSKKKVKPCSVLYDSLNLVKMDPASPQKLAAMLSLPSLCAKVNSMYSSAHGHKPDLGIYRTGESDSYAVYLFRLDFIKLFTAYSRLRREDEERLGHGHYTLITRSIYEHELNVIFRQWIAVGRVEVVCADGEFKEYAGAALKEIKAEAEKCKRTVRSK